ncbi:hypothetical protein TNCV_1055021 [Trichonephila clavipes]|nr:hypothetical protein TNCV_1055021 [Trichonephila clavipes]
MSSKRSAWCLSAKKFRSEYDDVQELSDFYNQELTIDELIEMQEQDIKELESFNPVQSEDKMTVGNSTKNLGCVTLNRIYLVPVGISHARTCNAHLVLN